MKTIMSFFVMVMFIILGVFRIINFNDADNLIGIKIIFSLAALFGITGVYFLKEKSNKKIWPIIELVIASAILVIGFLEIFYIDISKPDLIFPIFITTVSIGFVYYLIRQDWIKEKADRGDVAKNYIISLLSIFLIIFGILETLKIKNFFSFLILKINFDINLVLILFGSILFIYSFASYFIIEKERREIEKIEEEGNLMENQKNQQK